MIEQTTLQPMAAAQMAQPEPASAERQGETVFNALFGRFALPVSVVVLIVSVLMPARGVGFTICWFHHLTDGLPCPGCGLTRSVASFAHLELGQSLMYHPFGPLLWLAALFIVGVKLGGEARRQAVRRWFIAHGRGAYRTYMGIVFAFLAFGMGRLFWQIALTKLPPIYSQIH